MVRSRFGLVVRSLLVVSFLLVSPFQSAVTENTLPAPRDGDLAGVLINRTNLTDYREMVVPELLSLVRSGAVDIDGVNSLRYAVRYGSAWPTHGFGEVSQLLDSNGRLKFEPSNLHEGFLFGKRLGSSGEEEPKFGHGVLWDGQSVWWSQHVLDTRFTLSLSYDDRSYREFQGQYIRAYPISSGASESSETATRQLYRELLTVDSPGVLKGYSWLSYLFLGSEPELVWSYSPAIKKTRQLTNSNRTDPVLGSPLSLEDLLTWSGKPSGMEVEFLGEVEALTPFGGVNLQKEVVVPEDPAGCWSIDTGKAAVKKKGESDKFFQDTVLLPRQVVFTPRRLFKLRVEHKDPYSNYGRQVLYVDAGTMLPIYKIVYSPSGIRLKTVFTAFTFAEEEETRRRRPYPVYTFVRDHIKKVSALLEYSDTKICAGIVDPTVLRRFNPKALGVSS